mmetsp:Transcript_1482/g.3861  ORF Transcript_1482/g.3861 Transcript_1482/m.3861 type:complete len:585 (+) Transcript_1482:145-1899(+)
MPIEKDDKTSTIVSISTGQLLDATLTAVVSDLTGKKDGRSTPSFFRMRSNSRGESHRRHWTSKELCKQIVKNGHVTTPLEAQRLCRQLMISGALIERDKKHCAVEEFVHSDTTRKWLLRIRDVSSAASSASESPEPDDGLMAPTTAPTAVGTSAPGPVAFASETPPLTSTPLSVTFGATPTEGVGLGRSISDTSSDNSLSRRIGVTQKASTRHSPKRPDPIPPSRLRSETTSDALGLEATVSAGAENSGGESDEHDDIVMPLRQRRGANVTHTMMHHFDSAASVDDVPRSMSVDPDSLLKESGEDKLKEWFDILYDCSERIARAREIHAAQRAGKGLTVNDVVSDIMVDARDAITNISVLLDELHANEFLDSEMRNRIAAAEGVQLHLEETLPELRFQVEKKMETVDKGHDKECIRNFWNHLYVEKIQRLDEQHKGLKDRVWTLLRDGRDFAQRMSDFILFMDSMEDESSVNSEAIEEKFNWVVPVGNKFKIIGMRLLDRMATANFFRCRAAYVMMLNFLKQRLGEEAVCKYHNMTYIPIVVGISFLVWLLGQAFCFLGFKWTFFLMVCYFVYEYFIALRFAGQ